MAWTDLSALQLVSFNNLKNACDTGVFVAKTTIPATNEIITKADADTYATIDTSNATYAAKSSNQLISKRDLTTTFVFDADYILLTYRFTTGLDLDTRTRIVTPNIGQDTQPEYVGWAVLSKYPAAGNTYIEWGGDNLGTGVESALIYIANIKTDYPSATTIVIDCRSFWYNIIGTTPVNIEAKLWKGGSPIKQGSGGSPAFSWTNPTATSTFDVNSDSKTITLQTTASTTSGQRVATLTYGLTNSSGSFNVNDTTTPSV